MFEYIDDAYFLVGPRGRLPVSEHDEITRRLAMPLRRAMRRGPDHRDSAQVRLFAPALLSAL